MLPAFFFVFDKIQGKKKKNLITILTLATQTIFKVYKSQLCLENLA